MPTDFECKDCKHLSKNDDETPCSMCLWIFRNYGNRGNKFESKYSKCYWCGEYYVPEVTKFNSTDFCSLEHSKMNIDKLNRQEEN